MLFKNDYYENEVREGFFIPGMIKRSWAVQINILERVADICKKYGLVWYAAYGTLLGAVRHRGFIPWDDDLDICMFRKDYEIFLDIAKKELPNNYRLLCLETEQDYSELFARITNGNQIDITDNYLNNNCGFPYVAGIDIFPIDNIYADEKEEHNREEIVGQIADIYSNLKNDKRDYDIIVQEVEKICGFKVNRNAPINNALLEVIQKIISSCKSFESKKVAVMANYLKNKGVVYDYDWYGKPLSVSFENGVINVPSRYSKVLDVSYSNWEKASKRGAAHGYPFYIGQEEILFHQLGKGLYRYIPSDMRTIKNDTKGFDNEESNDEIRENLKLLKEAVEYLGTINLYKNSEGLELLIQCQEIAVKVGERIEYLWGVGTETVKCLEEFCENIYKLYENINSEIETKSVDEIEKLAVKMEKIEQIFRQLCERRRILFVYVKEYELVYYQHLIHEMCLTDTNHVNVMALPYWDRNNSGALNEIHIGKTGHVNGIFGLNYDVLLNGEVWFDEVYFGRPFDEYESGLTVDSHFYSHELKKRTNKLIYVHCLDVKNVEDEKSVENAKYYVITPGIIYADTILVPDSDIYELYCAVLKEGVNEFEKEKIEIDSRIKISYEKMTDFERKKRLLLYVALDELSDFDFIKHNLQDKLEILRKYADCLDIIWGIEKGNDSIVSEIQDMVNSLGIKNISLEDISFVAANIDEIDAYYGTGGYLMNLCVYKNKPTMIMKKTGIE